MPRFSILTLLGLAVSAILRIYKRHVWDTKYACVDHIPNFWLPWIIIAAILMFSVF